MSKEVAKKTKTKRTDRILDDEPLWTIGVPQEAAKRFASVGLRTIRDLRRAEPEDLYATCRVSFGMMEKLRDAAKAAGIECPTTDDATFAAAARKTPKWISENEKGRRERARKYREAVRALDELHVKHGLPKEYEKAEFDWAK